MKRLRSIHTLATAELAVTMYTQTLDYNFPHALHHGTKAQKVILKDQHINLSIKRFTVGSNISPPPPPNNHCVPRVVLEAAVKETQPGLQVKILKERSTVYTSVIRLSRVPCTIFGTAMSYLWRLDAGFTTPRP
jgi:hypothetical protein